MDVEEHLNNQNPNFEELEQHDYLDNEYLLKVIDKYSSLVGEFLISFSCLEHELNLAIADIIQDSAHETGYVVIEKLSMGNKIDLFYKMYLRLESATDKKSKQLLDKIRTQLESANNFRNSVVHANWQSLNKDGFVRTKITVDSQEGYVKFKRLQITPKFFRAMIRQVDGLIDKIDEYKEKAFNFQ